MLRLPWNSRVSQAPGPKSSARRWSVRLSILAGMALFLARPAAAPAQLSSGADSCPPGNLLAGKMPVEWRDIRGNRALATDGKKAVDGSIWNSTAAVILDTAVAELTYDLGRVIPLYAVWVQADANDTYRLYGSIDGNEFKPIGTVDLAEGVHGLRPRKVALGGTPVRFLRFGEGVGDNFYSVSELQAFCQLPEPFPPKMEEVSAPAAVPAKTILTFWNNESSATWELILAVLGCLLLYMNAEELKTGTASFSSKVRDRALMVLGALSLLTYFNFGFFHFPNWIHDWEWTHYYVGSKYFKELSYDRLYECIAIADHEDADPGLRKRVELRKIMNLRTNVLETTGGVLANPDACKSHFTAERWDSFKHDVKFFRDRQSPRRWDDLQTDHGYNGTPVWNIAGSVLSNMAPASEGQLYTLALLDPLYLLAAVGLIWWAFGWRVTCVGLLVFATNFPSRYYWTGGSFLRWDWIFYLVAGVCLLKKEKPLIAGVALGYSTLLRLFPAFVFTGPVLAFGIHLWKTRTIDQRYFKVLVGGALALVLLVPISFGVSGGPQAWVAFEKNSEKHSKTALTNYMGVRTILAYRPSEVGQKLRSDRLTDPWDAWKQARLRAWKQIKPVYALVALGFAVLLGFAVRGRPPWQAAALGATSIAMAHIELTCYYYAFVLAVALLYAEKERVGRLLLIMTALTGVINEHPTIGQFGFPTWLDEQYTLMSLVTVVVFMIIVYDFGLKQWLADRRAAAAPAVAAAAAGAAPAVSAADADTSDERPRSKRKK